MIRKVKRGKGYGLAGTGRVAGQSPAGSCLGKHWPPVTGCDIVTGGRMPVNTK